jgi:hypothetical protein
MPASPDLVAALLTASIYVCTSATDVEKRSAAIISCAELVVSTGGDALPAQADALAKALRSLPDGGLVINAHHIGNVKNADTDSREKIVELTSVHIDRGSSCFVIKLSDELNTQKPQYYVLCANAAMFSSDFFLCAVGNKAVRAVRVADFNDVCAHLCSAARASLSVELYLVTKPK